MTPKPIETVSTAKNTLLQFCPECGLKPLGTTKTAEGITRMEVNGNFYQVEPSKLCSYCGFQSYKKVL